MRFGEKGNNAFSGEKQLLGVDFKDMEPKDFNTLALEAGSEFGLTGHDIKKLKKLAGRN